MLETQVALAEGWPGHAAGQFAFATSNLKEGAHLYTIASAWNPDERRITFITKALGDHTERLPERLKVGMPVTIEGPYGCFDFEDQQPTQIWIGAGIGITPFVARMKQLARKHEAWTIHLFHSTSDFSQAAIDRLTADAAAAGYDYKFWFPARTIESTRRLSAARFRSGRARASGFADRPRSVNHCAETFAAHGLPPERFHQELFQMR